MADGLRYEADIHGHFVDVRGPRECGALYDAEGRITAVWGSDEDMDRLRRAIDTHAATAEARGLAEGRRQALAEIQAHVRRCFECGKPHEYRPIPERANMWTWADPVDGHTYRHMSPAEIEEWLFYAAADYLESVALNTEETRNG